MQLSHLRIVAASGGLVLALTACDGDDPDDLTQLLEDEQPADETPPDPAPEPDPEPEPDPDPEPDPFAVPDDIDADYVDLVMNELLAIDSQLLRDVLSRDPGQELTDDDAAIVRALFDGPRFLHGSENYLRYADEGDSHDAFLDPSDLGRIMWSTERVLKGGRSCVVAIGWYDLTEVAVEPYPDDEFSIASLSPARPESDSDINPTSWQLQDLKLLEDTAGDQIPEENWDRISYEDVLVTTCDEGDEGER